MSAASMATLRNVSNTPRRRRGSCKCLFGAPDRDETRRLMAEQYSRDRKRFIRRFNFDIDMECAYKSAKMDSPVKFLEENKENSESPILRSTTEALACVGNTDLKMLGSPSRRSNSSAASSPRTPRTPRTPRAARTPRTPRTPASRRQLQMTGQYLFLYNTLSYRKVKIPFGSVGRAPASRPEDLSSILVSYFNFHINSVYFVCVVFKPKS